MSVIKFKAKPRPTPGVILAARFDGSAMSVTAILEVARKCDGDAVAVVVHALNVVVVRWTDVLDDHPATTKYEVVERGKWLAFAELRRSLYTLDDRDLEHWYESVG